VPLEEYRRKRDFARTPEPAPGAASSRADASSPPGLGAPAPFAVRRRFVVQRHRATRLHYDLRLEIGGVLVSWAVPKGPSLDPDAKRMAVHVEDHPVDYFDFEGVIPRGEYGAGDVTVWDWGAWEPERETPDPASALAAGELKLRFRGEKLRGRATLVRTGQAERRRGTNEEDTGDPWLLIHKRDADAVAGWDAEDHPASVKTGRTNDEVAAGVAPRLTGTPPVGGVDPDVALAVPVAMPRFVEPMLATPGSAVPAGDDWLVEVKWDGYRTQALVGGGRTELRSRNGVDAGDWFPRLRGPADWIDAAEAIVDGEVVALDDDGRPDFSRLQERLGDASGGVVLIAFDLLHLDGYSLLEVPLEARKELLASRLRDDPRVRLSAHAIGGGPAYFEAAVRHGLEGVVAKRRRSRYVPGRRSGDWVKRKGRPGQELVVGGWTPVTGNRNELGALAVGVYEGDALRFAGMVGSGFDARSRRDLLARLASLEIDTPPFDPPPPAGARSRWGKNLAGVRWVRPELVVGVEIAGWTRDGSVRQAAYKGLLDDRDPRTVAREAVVDVASETPTSASSAQAPSDSPGRSRRAATADELAALASMTRDGAWRIGGQELKLTNLDKVLFPPRDGVDEPPATKRELIAYFAQVAPAMLPHLAGRPLNLQRFPDGAGRAGFWQKQIPAAAPAWLTRWHESGFEDRGGRPDRTPNDHLVADGVAALCWLANQAAFEVHAWTSTCEDPWRPTYALIDIDPGVDTTWEQTLVLASLYRTALGHLGVRAYPKVTGGRGLHAWIPVERGRYSYSETSAWVETLSRAVGSAVPDLVSWDWAKKDRGGRARLDYTQNAGIKTLVAPYAVRPRPGAPVSAPITWDELDDPALRADRWTIRSVLERLAERGDPWAALPGDRQVLPPL
jgi:bifunctional non-homologous end joining protein LigD